MWKQEIIERDFRWDIDGSKDYVSDKTFVNKVTERLNEIEVGHNKHINVHYMNNNVAIISYKEING
jgi:hypothetical protein